MPPNLDTLAVELIAEILKGADLRTISSVALTSRRLYHVVKTNRKLWTDACDILDLPLQTGEILATTPTESILPLALRAVSIQTRLENPASIPRIRRIHLGFISSWKLLPGGEWRLCTQDNNLWVVNNKEESKALPAVATFVAPSTIRCSAFEALGNREMRLAVGIGVDRDREETDRPQVSIIHLRFPVQDSSQARDRPLVISVKSYSLPATPSFVSLCRPLVLLKFRDTAGVRLASFRAAILDCEANVGVHLEAQPPTFEEVRLPRQGTSWEWLQVHFHPALQKLVLRAEIRVDAYATNPPPQTVVVLADMPTLSQPIEVAPNTAAPNLFQTPEPLTFTHMHLEAISAPPLPLPLPSRYVSITEYATNDAQEFFSLCLDTDAPTSHDGELVAFLVHRAYNDCTHLCSSDICHNSTRFQEAIDRQAVVTYLNRAFTRVSRLMIPLPPEALPKSTQDPEKKLSFESTLLEVEMNHGVLSMSVIWSHRAVRESADSGRAFFGPRTHATWSFSSFYLLQY
ncbi:hypothetical protein SISSUDRAFT_1045420 [Sistotremastrum suecicum HHB10207 ss-3]|uniref:F-box domain-containing protein n=1 Tax=Sistotremastrum suecicum HHB10207 ss-3 TaxID=1314776 RepID=A0A166EFX7_9AGAM|nr:hypothetical protein SISSUDRAFT_1045420 [Sistotremastrum suecicum HHB10207 ss-3]